MKVQLRRYWLSTTSECRAELLSRWLCGISSGRIFDMLMSIPQCIYWKSQTLSQWWRIWFWLSISGNSAEKLHFGNVDNMAYWVYSDHPLYSTGSIGLRRNERFTVSSFPLFIMSRKLPFKRRKTSLWVSLYMAYGTKIHLYERLTGEYWKPLIMSTITRIVKWLGAEKSVFLKPSNKPLKCEHSATTNLGGAYK